MTDPFPNDGFPGPEAQDPLRAAQAGLKAALPRRFYAQAGVEPHEGGFRLVLDGRPARTPARQSLTLPNRALAEAVAAEWAAQGAEIDPATMPMTRIANSALDGVAARAAEVAADIAGYAACDLTCYRAGTPERLVAEQGTAWDPVLAFARDSLGARFVLSEGIMPVAQPEEALRAVRRRVESVGSPFALAALHVMTTLTGSVLIALAHAEGHLDAGGAWAAAHADERYQESVWGGDWEAAQRREAREADFRAASRTYALALREEALPGARVPPPDGAC